MASLGPAPRAGLGLFNVDPGTSGFHNVGPMDATRPFALWLDRGTLPCHTVRAGVDLRRLAGTVDPGGDRDRLVLPGLTGHDCDKNLGVSAPS